MICPMSCPPFDSLPISQVLGTGGARGEISQAWSGGVGSQSPRKNAGGGAPGELSEQESGHFSRVDLASDQKAQSARRVQMAAGNPAGGGNHHRNREPMGQRHAEQS